MKHENEQRSEKMFEMLKRRRTESASKAGNFQSGSSRGTLTGFVLAVEEVDDNKSKTPQVRVTIVPSRASSSKECHIAGAPGCQFILPTKRVPLSVPAGGLGMNNEIASKQTHEHVLSAPVHMHHLGVISSLVYANNNDKHKDATPIQLLKEQLRAGSTVCFNGVTFQAAISKGGEPTYYANITPEKSTPRKAIAQFNPVREAMNNSELQQAAYSMITGFAMPGSLVSAIRNDDSSVAYRARKKDVACRIQAEKGARGYIGRLADMGAIDIEARAQLLKIGTTGTTTAVADKLAVYNRLVADGSETLANEFLRAHGDMSVPASTVQFDDMSTTESLAAFNTTGMEKGTHSTPERIFDAAVRDEASIAGAGGLASTIQSVVCPLVVNPGHRLDEAVFLSGGCQMCSIVFCNSSSNPPEVAKRQTPMVECVFNDPQQDGSFSSLIVGDKITEIVLDVCAVKNPSDLYKCMSAPAGPDAIPTEGLNGAGMLYCSAFAGFKVSTPRLAAQVGTLSKRHALNLLRCMLPFTPMLTAAHLVTTPHGASMDEPSDNMTGRDKSKEFAPVSLDLPRGIFNAGVEVSREWVLKHFEHEFAPSGDEQIKGLTMLFGIEDVQPGNDAIDKHYSKNRRVEMKDVGACNLLEQIMVPLAKIEKDAAAYCANAYPNKEASSALRYFVVGASHATLQKIDDQPHDATTGAREQILEDDYPSGKPHLLVPFAVAACCFW